MCTRGRGNIHCCKIYLNNKDLCQHFLSSYYFLLPYWNKLPEPIYVAFSRDLGYFDSAWYIHSYIWGTSILTKFNLLNSSYLATVHTVNSYMFIFVIICLIMSMTIVNKFLEDLNSNLIIIIFTVLSASISFLLIDYQSLSFMQYVIGKTFTCAWGIYSYLYRCGCIMCQRVFTFYYPESFNIYILFSKQSVYLISHPTSNYTKLSSMLMFTWWEPSHCLLLLLLYL